ncbi:response regulator transcription factor [Nocardia sp. NPDC050697]|uniref:response regulator transcription factor n=1 Tax=Nocardia sp. NPDC050697 TaxID=3155158 RepID=UPI00340B149F
MSVDERIPVRIGVVEDHAVMVAGLRIILAPHPELRIEAAAETVKELLTQRVPLDLVILDLRLNDGSAPGDNVNRLRAAGLRTLVYTSGEDPYLMRAAARAGVGGMVLKSEPPERVVEAVRAAAREDGELGTELALAIDGDEDFAVDLPPQLRQVLELYASGETAARVAHLMDIAEDTVTEYLKRIRRKYEAAGRPSGNRAELLKRAVEDGWLPIPRRRGR